MICSLNIFDETGGSRGGNTMEFTKERILQRKMAAVESAIFEDSLGLDTWQTREGFYVSPGEYTNYGQWEEISVGDRWRCSDGVTRWFKRTVVIPTEFAGKTVVLDLEFGGEGLVRIDGVIQSALTSYIKENEATRTRVVLPWVPKAGESFNIEVETGLNYMEFAAYRQQGKTSIEYQFRNVPMIDY
jgi:hypothetical protein